MKALALLLLCPLCLFAKTSYYDLVMLLKVPVILNNAQSLGSRQYRLQRIRGRVIVEHFPDSEPEVSFVDMVNRSHKLSSGAYVTYKTVVDKVGWHAVGSNKTGIFRKPSIFVSIEATPSYALADGEDNTLVVTLSGSGTNDKRVHGYVAGQLGCGCYAYGHTSPTRILGTCTVVDTAAVWGTFTMRKTMECD